MTANWTHADTLRDASVQTAEHNDALRAEYASDREAYLDEHDYLDDRPTRAEVEAAEFEDWSWWREQGEPR